MRLLHRHSPATEVGTFVADTIITFHRTLLSINIQDCIVTPEDVL